MDVICYLFISWLLGSHCTSHRRTFAEHSLRRHRSIPRWNLLLVRPFRHFKYLLFPGRKHRRWNLIPFSTIRITTNPKSHPLRSVSQRRQLLLLDGDLRSQFLLFVMLLRGDSFVWSAFSKGWTSFVLIGVVHLRLSFLANIIIQTTFRIES